MLPVQAAAKQNPAYMPLHPPLIGPLKKAHACDQQACADSEASAAMLKLRKVKRRHTCDAASPSSARRCSACSLVFLAFSSASCSSIVVVVQLKWLRHSPSSSFSTICQLDPRDNYARLAAGWSTAAVTDGDVMGLLCKQTSLIACHIPFGASCVPGCPCPGSPQAPDTCTQFCSTLSA